MSDRIRKSALVAAGVLSAISAIQASAQDVQLEEIVITARQREEKLVGALKVLEAQGTALRGEADVVVVSSAIRPLNPEVIEARRRHVPVIPRAEMLAALCSRRRSIAVAGTHGKTTTSSLLVRAMDSVPTVLCKAPLALASAPSCLIGARVFFSLYLVS